MKSVSEKSGTSKKAARDRRPQVKARREEGPVSEKILRAAEKIGATPSDSAKAEMAPPTVDDALDAEAAAETARAKAAYEKAGIPFADYPKSEEQTAHERLRRIEKKVLASKESDSLRSQLMRILSAGAYVDDDAGQGDDTTPERALLRYAAATSKAAAFALMGAEYVCSNHNFDAEFDDEAIVMCCLSELLKVAPGLLTSISIADNAANAKSGGVS
jgi:hypothetical protein